MEGFESAYRRHFSAVLRFAQSLVGRRDIAEDLTADAFVELHRHFERIVVEELPAWLFVVVRNRARDLWRRQLVEQRHAQWLAREPVETARPSAGPLWLSTDGLAPVHRVCLEMHYVGVDVAHNDTRLAIGMQADSHLVITITHFKWTGSDQSCGTSWADPLRDGRRHARPGMRAGRVAGRQCIRPAASQRERDARGLAGMAQGAAGARGGAQDLNGERQPGRFGSVALRAQALTAPDGTRGSGCG